MNILSGANTPPEAMPPLPRAVMSASPSTHFVSFARSILYRGADRSVIWPDYLFVAVVGGLFILALIRFRAVAAQAG